ncbi:unnamed protein product [Leptidea sinapis]|nr:unnamed protein product [Leptidea sinapis]
MAELLKLCHSFCSSSQFNKLVKQLMQLLVALRDRPCGVFLARLLMRLDYNRWLSGEAQLTRSVTSMLKY